MKRDWLAFAAVLAFIVILVVWAWVIGEGSL
jgi:hypothetical protein